MFLEDRNKFAGVEAKPDPFTLPALIAWLRTRPADEEYDFSDTHGKNGGCVFFRYGVSIGHSADWDGYMKTISGFNGGKFTCDDPFTINGAGIAAHFPHTMGNVLAHAEALL